LVECYRAAGIGAEVGQSVSFIVTQAPVDPAEEGHGTVGALVYLD
jgi:hypothetical protein